MDSVYITRVDTAFAATTGAKTVLKLVTPTTFAIMIVWRSLDGR